MQNLSKVNVVVVTNITLEPFFGMYLKETFEKEGLNVRLNSIPFNEYLLQENLDKLVNADQIVVWLNIDGFYPNLINNLIGRKESADDIEQDIKNKFINLNASIKQKSRASILWLGTEDYCYYPYTYHLGYSLINRGFIDRINIALNEIAEENDTYVDLKTIIAKLGIERAFDNKSKYRWNTPYSRELLQAIADEVRKQYLTYNGITKKCVVLDCDNVLWGGILSEDGIERIQLGSSGLGRPYQDFQRFMLNLYYHGVIITICSKNDKSDVLRVFREHDEMILREEHIACFCANWDNKADNIKAIAGTLNIGLDSIVFIDDSDFEIQSIKALLPEVTAIKYERDTVYGKLSCFNLKSNIDIEKVERRNLTYQTNELRRNLKSETSSLGEYLNALEMMVYINEALPIELSRIADLTHRTNNCTNCRRYTAQQIKQKLNDGYELYSVSLSDKFSDLGLVGVIGIDGKTLDLFSLSCRALGRNIEQIMIDFITEKNIKGIHYDLTPRNHELHSKLSDLLKQ